MENNDLAVVENIGNMIEAFKVGTISRRQLFSGLLGAAVGAAMLSEEVDADCIHAHTGIDQGMKVLLERIINHRYCIVTDGDGNPTNEVQLLNSDFKVFKNTAQHQKWLFSSGPAGSGGYDGKGLVDYDGSTDHPAIRSDLKERTNNPSVSDLVDHNGSDFKIDSNNKRHALREIVTESKLHLGLLENDSTPRPHGKQYRHDLYGLVRAKLDWQCTHCTTHTVADVLKALKKFDGDNTSFAESVAKLFDRDDSENVGPGWAMLKDKFGGETAPDWDHTQDHYLNEVSADHISSHDAY